MKQLAFILITTFYSVVSFAQTGKGSYTQINISTPLKENLNSEDDNPDWFVPNGLSLKIGEGIHYNRKIAFGLNTGIDWIASKKLVVIPAYGNIKLSVNLDPEMSCFIQTSYGKSIILGRGNLHGDYKKISIGIESIDGFAFFAEATQYGFIFDSPRKVANLSLGISVSSYKSKPKHTNNTSSP